LNGYPEKLIHTFLLCTKPLWRQSSSRKAALSFNLEIIMTTEQERKDIEFKTFDGLTLRGWFYVGPKGGPAIIINVAVNQP
jgi:hypothetical protein